MHGALQSGFRRLRMPGCRRCARLPKEGFCAARTLQDTVLTDDRVISPVASARKFPVRFYGTAVELEMARAFFTQTILADSPVVSGLHIIVVE